MIVGLLIANLVVSSLILALALLVLLSASVAARGKRQALEQLAQQTDEHGNINLADILNGHVGGSHGSPARQVEAEGS